MQYSSYFINEVARKATDGKKKKVKKMVFKGFTV